MELFLKEYCFEFNQIFLLGDALRPLTSAFKKQRQKTSLENKQQNALKKLIHH